MDYDVSVDRDKYIGGSDIPVIMGISTFKSRYNLLLEKAGLKENEFTGNRYTEYGNIIEPQIRAYINRKRKKKFEPNRVINGDMRCHTDGFNGECVLEIKSTSHIYSTVDEYKVYLVQLIKYMEENHVKKGILAVYERPEDFNPDFNPDRLKVYDIKLSDYADLLEAVNRELDRFRSDLSRLKENPLLSEEDFLPARNQLIELSNKIIAFENQLSAMKVIEKQLAEAKASLFEEMAKHDVKSWETPNGTKISRVDGVPAGTKTVTEFNEKAFKSENPALYEMYLHEVAKKTAGRNGYVRITLPKGVSEDV
jgi:putative phage-type endonuclease